MKLKDLDLLHSSSDKLTRVSTNNEGYHCTWKMTGVKRRLCSDSDTHALHEELDEVLCPICMDHPHNAVLLLCSSHDKGCRTYICDTSHRHSNCLDQFKKTKALSCSLVNTHNSGNSSDINLSMRSDSNEFNEINTVLSVGLPQGSGQADVQDPSRHSDSHDEAILETVDSEILQDRAEHEHGGENSSESKLCLKCPLCRGIVLGWKVVEEARSYLNLKKRSCSRESCSFVGNYLELRRHARIVHPTTCPSDIDPLRERSWQHLERQREYGDIVSAVRSAMPGAMVVGDYVIENGDGRLRPGEREGSGSDDANGSLWATIYLFQMLGSGENGHEPRPRPQRRSRAWTRYRRAGGGGGGGGSSDRRLLWGENLLGVGDDVLDDMPMISYLGGDAVPRRRRRLTRTRFSEDHQR